MADQFARCSLEESRQEVCSREYDLYVTGEPLPAPGNSLRLDMKRMNEKAPGAQKATSRLAPSDQLPLESVPI